MKKVGLVGGIGPASTPEYYLGIINGYRNKTGDTHYPEIIIYSIDMTEMLLNIENDNWDKVIAQLSHALEKLAIAGADFAAIASNTPHLMFDEIKERSPLPLISIVDETCRFIRDAQYQRVLTIGTLFTMKSGLYANPLKEQGVLSILPSDDEQEEIYSLFFPNLENGIVVAEDKKKMLALLNSIISEQNADSLILGCTELPLMIGQGDLAIPIVDTTRIHIEAIVNYMLA